MAGDFPPETLRIGTLPGLDRHEGVGYSQPNKIKGTSTPALEEILITPPVMERYTKELRQNLNPEVAVAGGGAAGLTAARRRAPRGRKVAVGGRPRSSPGDRLLSGHQGAGLVTPRRVPG